MKKGLSINKQIALSFFLAIFIGSVLLSLPMSQLASSKANYIDHLFISVSAVCVTGLFTQPIFSTYTLFGQIVLLFMIQIGGLGLMTIISSIMLRAGLKLKYSDTMAVSEALNKEGKAGFKGFILSILKYTFIFEAIGALIFMVVLIPEFGLGKGIFNSIFLSISAFCNAGFDNYNASSLQSFAFNPIINFTVTSLIILGGIGFGVWFDIKQNATSLIKKGSYSLVKLFKKLKVHSRLVLTVSFFVIVVGTVLGIMIEGTNPETWGSMSFWDKFMHSYFQTVTMRTAGFATVDYTQLKPVSNFIYIVTMLIGGSPGGTAGGIKTTTMTLVFMLVYVEFRGGRNVNIFKHTVSTEALRKATIVFVSFMAALVLGVLMLLIFDPHVPLLSSLFEVVSALNTVGVTMNLTPTLSLGSLITLMVLMFTGRIGPMTMLLSFTKQHESHHTDNQYSSASILIG
ncbi:MAG TPA: potassium transporter [Erysipelothrix sp.]|nr:potassium transporter [Erysipelothrix sp.]